MWINRRRTDEQLLAACAVDAQAFAVFYERHERLIVGYLMRRTGDAEVTADLTAEVFAAALEAAGRYRAVGESAAPWLVTIAHNALASSQRRGIVEDSARRSLEMSGPITLRAASLRRVESSIAGDSWVCEVLAGLPAAEAEAVRARILEDCSYEEIAERLQTSSLVIRKRVSRGLARLRNELRGGRP